MSDKTIYVVTEGEYSDYHICAVFDNKELAEQYVKATDSNYRWADKKEIEEYTLNENEKELKKGYSFFRVTMDKNGGSNVERANFTCEPTFFNKSNETFFRMWVMAKDEQHAVKIVNEKRVQLLAENNWGKKE